MQVQLIVEYYAWYGGTLIHFVVHLQTKFGARCKAWNLAPYNPEAPPCIKLRLEETLNMPNEIDGLIDRKRIQR